MTDKTYYITTPIYYVNDVPHIGHAYTTLACDVLARFKRLDGYDVRFLTGTDEHGQKVEKSAAAAGVEPIVLCDKNAARFQALAEAMHISHDQFIRTTEDRHIKACQDLWHRIADAGYIYEDNYGGWYAVRDEAYYAESELITGEGGEKLAPTGAPVEWVEEPSFFFKLSEFQEKLLAFYEEKPDCILPKSRYNEVKSFVEGGLKDLSISRTTFNWGVPVPGNDKHIMYVWIDALTNYMTGLGYPDTESPDYKRFWPADVHMIGKDILRFHAVYWPAFLMAADLPLPKRVFAHGWWTNEGEKISKSLGNVIDPFELIEEFGLDAVRYFLMAEVPFGSDGDFSRERFITRMNSELANDLGNLAQRCLSMIYKNCDGKIPHPDTDELTLRGIDGLMHFMDSLQIDKYISMIWHWIRLQNQEFANAEPWTLKGEPEKMGAVLYLTAETVRQIAILLQPVMPDAMGKMLDNMSVPTDERTFAHILSSPLKPGTEIPKPEGVFPRYQPKDAE